jgi:hypothetical protein
MAKALFEMILCARQAKAWLKIKRKNGAKQLFSI